MKKRLARLRSGIRRMTSALAAARQPSREPEPRVEPSGPREINVYLTSRCNARCPFCALTLGHTPEVPDVTPQLIDRVVARYPTLENACIAGFGEPTLSSQLYPVVDRLRQAGLGVSLISNGMLLHKHLERLSEREWLYLNVSLNAADPDEHSRRMHVDRMFGRVCESAGKAASAGLPVGLSFVVGRSNVKRVPGYLELAAKLGVRFVSLLNTLPHGGPEDAEILRSSDVGACDFLEQLRASDAPGVALVNAWPTPVDESPPWACQSPFLAVGVDGRGSLSACRRVLAPDPRYGSLDDAGYHGSHFGALRTAMQDRTAHALDEPCTTCFGNWKG